MSASFTTTNGTVMSRLQSDRDQWSVIVHTHLALNGIKDPGEFCSRFDFNEPHFTAALEGKTPFLVDHLIAVAGLSSVPLSHLFRQFNSQG